MPVMSNRMRQQRIHWLMEDFTDLVDKLKYEPLVEAGYWLSEKLIKVVCLFYGHYIIGDQCGIPEHRYCTYCGKSMPNKEITR